MPASATLEISLPAIRANYRLLKDRHAKNALAAVVKANAYGLGIEAVSRALSAEGCHEFFVATLEEGIELRRILPRAEIAIFNGLLPREEKDYVRHHLTPVLNEVAQVQRFVAKETGFGIRDKAYIHVDTGMTRLGLSADEVKKLPHIPYAESRIMLMSHLACANDAASPKNSDQLQRFKDALALFPGARASLCNSSGLFLLPGFHFDVARPGCALYGINPTNGQNPMQQVAVLSAPILQIRALDRDEDIGYGATYKATKGSRIAVAALGYADGWPRLLSNKGFAYIAGHKTPIIGRISMDMLALDITGVPEPRAETKAEFINAHQTVDDIATACGTIGYEIFTRIGDRVKRVYA